MDAIYLSALVTCSAIYWLNNSGMNVPPDGPTFYFLPVNGHFTNRKLEMLSNVQQFNIKCPENAQDIKLF